MDETVINLINNLVALDLACAAAYETAAGVCKDEKIQGKLTEFKNDHDRHVRELSEVVKQAGKEAPSDLDAKGVIIKGFTMLSAQEDRTAVLAMRGNEELSNNAYASALKAELPIEIRDMVQANFDDERRHMSWIREAALERGWDAEQPEIRDAAVESMRKAA
jgi:uncharacterized protein (TIGR02284 family)